MKFSPFTSGKEQKTVTAYPEEHFLFVTQKTEQIIRLTQEDAYDTL